MNHRLHKLRSQFPHLGIDAFLVTNPPHLRYVSNFSGSSGIGFITKTLTVLITDGRYTTQARRQAKGWSVRIAPDSLFEELGKTNLLRKGLRIGFDGNVLPYSLCLSLKKRFPWVQFLSKIGSVERIAAVKEPTEVRKIRRAVAITDKVFDEILGVIRPGVTELDIAAEISYRHRKHGAEADAFESIVASGPRGALPHGHASSRKIRNREFVTLDFGCVYEGYYSDFTRTVSVGKPSQEWKSIYQIVLDAQRKAIDAAATGMAARDLDAVARNHIRKMGYDEYFNHSLGHGLGMQIHEPPRISTRSSARLQSGNVITIEPGIYIPHSGGVRIEDDVLVTNGSCEVLTTSEKELLIL